MHCCWAAEREFGHSVFRFPLCSKDLVERCSSNRTFLRQRRCAERLLGIRTSHPNLFESVVHFSDSTGQLINCAFSFDMHEIDLWMVEKEMVMQCGDIQAVVERGRHRSVDFVFK